MNNGTGSELEDLDNDVAALILYDGLSSKAGLAECAAKIYKYVLSANSRFSASPVILEALARIALSNDPDARSNAVTALLWFCCCSWREWSVLVQSSLLNAAPDVVEIVCKAVFGETPSNTCSKDFAKLTTFTRELSSSIHDFPSVVTATPFSVAIAHIVRSYYDLDKRETSMQPGRVKHAAWSKDHCLGKLYAALEQFTPAYWLAVSDDDFAGVIDVLVNNFDSERTRDVLTSKCCNSRLRALFMSATPAAGYVYGLLQNVAMEFQLFGICAADYQVYKRSASFKLGMAEHMQWTHGETSEEVDNTSDVCDDLAQIFTLARNKDAKAKRLLNGQVRKWQYLRKCGNETERKHAALSLATAYVASPDELVQYVDFDIEKWISEIPTVLRGPVDVEIEHGILSMLDHVCDIRPLLFSRDIFVTGRNCSWNGSRLRESRLHAEDGGISTSFLRLKRMVILHRGIALRHIGAMCGGIHAALCSSFPHSMSVVRCVTSLLQILVALRPENSVEGQHAELTHAAALSAVTSALAEGRATHGVHGEYAAMAAAACEILHYLNCSMLSNQSTLPDDNDSVRTQLQSMLQAPNTDDFLRAVVENLLNKWTED